VIPANRGSATHPGRVAAAGVVKGKLIHGRRAKSSGLLTKEEGEGGGAGGEEVQAGRAVLLDQGQGSADQGIHQPAGVGAIVNGGGSRFGELQMEPMADRQLQLLDGAVGIGEGRPGERHHHGEIVSGL